MELTEFKQLVIPFSPKLLRFANRILGNTENAKDVVQDVFLKLWLMRDQLQTLRSAEAYAMTMTRNLCIDQLRKLRPERLTDEMSHQQGGTEDELESVMDWKEEGSRGIQIVNQLPELQRTVIHLRDIEGYNADEVMEMLGMNANAMRVTLSRARKKVREIMLNKNLSTWTAGQ